MPSQGHDANINFITSCIYWLEGSPNDDLSQCVILSNSDLYIEYRRLDVIVLAEILRLLDEVKNEIGRYIVDNRPEFTASFCFLAIEYGHIEQSLHISLNGSNLLKREDDLLKWTNIGVGVLSIISAAFRIFNAWKASQSEYRKAQSDKQTFPVMKSVLQPEMEQKKEAWFQIKDSAAGSLVQYLSSIANIRKVTVNFDILLDKGK